MEVEVKLLISFATALTLAACAPGNTEDDMTGTDTRSSGGPASGAPPVVRETEANRTQATPGPGEVPGPAIRQDQADASPRPGSESAAPPPSDGPS